MKETMKGSSPRVQGKALATVGDQKSKKDNKTVPHAQINNFMDRAYNSQNPPQQLIPMQVRTPR